MMGQRYIQHHFSHETVDLDDNEFIGCTFESCRLRYSGGPHPRMQGNEVIDSPIVFAGDALQTVTFLHKIYHGGWMQNVEQIIAGWREVPPDEVFG